MPQMNATAVVPLNENTIDFFKKIQMNHPIPEDALYIAFLEDGDACFLTEKLSSNPLDGLLLPQFSMITYYENIQIQFED